MGILYDDRSLCAARWLLNYLYKNHCHKITSPVREHNGYRGDVVKIPDVAKKTTYYNKEILGQGAEILFNNGHIQYQSKNIAFVEESSIYILEKGRMAVKSSLYLKLILKKWGKRILFFKSFR